MENSDILKAYFRSAIIVLSLFSLVSCAAFRAPSEKSVENYKPDMANTLVNFSDYAYLKTEESLINALNKNYPSYKLLRKIGEKESGYDTQGFVAYNDKNVIVSIRGSENPITTLDWINNFKVLHYTNKKSKNYCENFGVHGGFHKSALVIKDISLGDGSSILVHQKISSLQQGGRKVYFTGHSLGGAIANMLAFFMSYETNTEIEGVYTFGEPKGGNLAYKKCHDDKLLNRTFRFVNNRDGVPRMKGGGSYVHVGNLVYFDSNGNVHKFVTTNIPNLIKDTLLGKFALNHRLKNYIKLVEESKEINPFSG